MVLRLLLASFAQEKYLNWGSGGGGWGWMAANEMRDSKEAEI